MTSLNVAINSLADYLATLNSNEEFNRNKLPTPTLTVTDSGPRYVALAHFKAALNTALTPPVRGAGVAAG
jgi:hypothetical protein